MAFAAGFIFSDAYVYMIVKLLMLVSVGFNLSLCLLAFRLLLLGVQLVHAIGFGTIHGLPFLHMSSLVGCTKKNMITLPHLVCSSY